MKWATSNMAVTKKIAKFLRMAKERSGLIQGSDSMKGLINWLNADVAWDCDLTNCEVKELDATGFEVYGAKLTYETTLTGLFLAAFVSLLLRV